MKLIILLILGMFAIFGCLQSTPTPSGLVYHPDYRIHLVSQSTGQLVNNFDVSVTRVGTPTTTILVFNNVSSETNINSDGNPEHSLDFCASSCQFTISKPGYQTVTVTPNLPFEMANHAPIYINAQTN